jgi:hypothetical protein
MKITKVFIGLYALLLAGLLTGCEGDYDTGWKQEQPSEDAMETGAWAYFNTANAKSYVWEFGLENDYMIHLKVNRPSATNAISLPVVVDAGSKYFTVPSTVEFAAGQTETTLDVQFTATEPDSVGKVRSLSIHMEDSEEAMAYTKSAVTVTAATSKGWIPYYKDVYSYWSSTYATIYQDIEVYQGTANFRIKDFLNSGQDLKFTLYRKDNGNIVTAEDLEKNVNMQCGIIIDETQATFDAEYYWYDWKIDLYPLLLDGVTKGEILAGEGMYGSSPEVQAYLYLCYMWIGADVTTNTTIGSFCFYLNSAYNYFTWYNYAKPAAQ